MSIVGIIALTSLSGGIMASMRDTVGLVQGILIFQKTIPSPVLSSLPLALEAKLRAVKGVRAVMPEIFFPAFVVEGTDYRTRAITDFLAVNGSDPARVADFEGGGIFARKMLRGRMLAKGDATAIVLSERVSELHRKGLGDRIEVNGVAFEVVGVFKTGTIFLDNTLVVPIEQARRMARKRDDLVSVFYVEATDPTEAAAVAERIRKALPEVDARATADWAEEIATLMVNVDVFLFAISLVAVAVGAIGILNTMLMSVMERTPEFGILRANGWTRGDVARLVILESLILGALGGLLGCGTGVLGVWVAGAFLPVPPTAGPVWLAVSYAMALVLGASGGLYPAWRASRLDPIEAIRRG